MTRIIFAIFFSVIFLSVMAVPTIMYVFGDDIKISAVWDANEEENKSNEILKDFKIEVVQLKNNLDLIFNLNSKRTTPFYPRIYRSLNLTLHSPPPEFLLSLSKV